MIEFVLAAEGQGRRTCTSICRILEPAADWVGGRRPHRRRDPRLLGAPTTAPPAANLLACAAENSSRRPRSRRPDEPRILRSDAVRMVVGEAEICVFEPVWMVRLGAAPVLPGLVSKL